MGYTSYYLWFLASLVVLPGLAIMWARAVVRQMRASAKLFEEGTCVDYTAEPPPIFQSRKIADMRRVLRERGYSVFMHAHNSARAHAGLPNMDLVFTSEDRMRRVTISCQKWRRYFLLLEVPLPRLTGRWLTAVEVQSCFDTLRLVTITAPPPPAERDLEGYRVQYIGFDASLREAMAVHDEAFKEEIVKRKALQLDDSKENYFAERIELRDRLANRLKKKVNDAIEEGASTWPVPID